MWCRIATPRPVAAQRQASKGGLGMAPTEPPVIPTPGEVGAARVATGLSIREAAELIHSKVRTWQDWERGVAKMHPGLWELFQLKTRARR